jgi:hypothetical protein
MGCTRYYMAVRPSFIRYGHLISRTYRPERITYRRDTAIAILLF